MAIWLEENYSENYGIKFKVKRTLYDQQTKYQNLKIVETYDAGNVMVLDDCIMFTDKDEFVYHEMISQIPMFCHPNVENVLIVGGGDGGTIREVIKHDSVKRVDLVEIDEEVIKTSKEFFPKIASGFNDPRVNVYVEDGIKFVKDKTNEYDLIIIDSTDPFGPAEGLFTVDFYQNVYKALKEDGIVTNQAESPFQDVFTGKNYVSHTFKILRQVFDICMPYTGFVPGYPTGMWMWGFSSKKYHPVKDFNMEKYLEVTKKHEYDYYNDELHKGCFAIPNFVKRMIK